VYHAHVFLKIFDQVDKTLNIILGLIQMIYFNLKKIISFSIARTFKLILYFGLQICITGSTSAGLHQILPWLYYHKVIGVSHFILFVEGEAAKPAVTSVLESIRVNKSFHTPLLLLVISLRKLPLTFCAPSLGCKNCLQN